MRIRNANKSDAQQIEDLVKGLSHFYLKDIHGHLPDWLSNALSKKELENKIISHEYLNLLCEINDEIVGYISIKNKEHVYHLFVAKDYHRQGIAKKLWENAKVLCQSSKYTVRSSLYAVPVYEKFGFEKISVVKSKDDIQFQEMELFV